MRKLIFISYRKKDSLPAARGIAEQLSAVFGHSTVFLDQNSISAGDRWPSRIKQALKQTKVMLCVIGPTWLTASDEFGRRRLDMKSDWVRQEIAFALESSIPIIPLIVEGGYFPNHIEALPESLTTLLQYQVVCLPDEHWRIQMQELIRRLSNDHGLVISETKVEYPERMVSISPLTPEELDEILTQLPGWEVVESAIPGDYPKSRIELRKVFKFRDFISAIEFMASAADYIERTSPPHHPRWENLWRTVTVWLSTWDIEHNVSRLDVDLARELERRYLKFRTKLSTSLGRNRTLDRNEKTWDEEGSLPVSGNLPVAAESVVMTRRGRPKILDTRISRFDSTSDD